MQDGGLYEGDEHARVKVLRLAVELGADYVELDIEV